MRIAIIEHSKSGDYAEYIFSLLNEKAKENNYQVKTWSNSVPAFQQQITDDAIIHVYNENNSTLSLKWLYKIKIPSILRKTKAEVLIDLNGIASNKIKIPQLIAAAPFLFNEDAKHLKKAEQFVFKHFSNSIKLAKNILSYSKEKMTDAHKKEKFQPVFFTAPDIFKMYEWHDKIMVKAQYADNKEFFVAIIEDNAVHNFVLLLQAFSKFKKWQQSSMQLIVFPKYEALGENIEEKHTTYKYREDVHLIKDVEEKQIAAIIASAHSLIHIPADIPHLLIIAVAMQCSLPVIAFKDNDVKEYAGNAVLFCENKTAEALGDAIIQLYKDEKLHAYLKEEAQKQSLFLNRKECEEKLWQLIETAAHS